MNLATEQHEHSGTGDPTVPASAGIAAICKAAADPLRVTIIRVLARDSFGVVELAKIFDMPQPGMSHHLKILAGAGLVTARRQGNTIFYRRPLVRAVSTLDTLRETLFRSIDSTALADDVIGRIDQIHDERSAQSRLFFERHAAKFRDHQGRLCEWDEYAAHVLDLLRLVPSAREKTALEVGPGEGLLLQELAASFRKVVALDNSEKMLDLARSGLKNNTKKVEFVCKSLDALKARDYTFDVAVLNMVLHHMASPASTFQKLGQLVREGGLLLIADLCAHDQEWTRESCGDTWPGFAPEDIASWAKDAGFSEVQSQYLGLRNGFQIQLRLFQHH